MYVVTVDHVMSETQPHSSWQPVSAEEFADWFDSDGRLVREVTMRQRVFEGTCVSARFPTSFLCCLPVTSPPSPPTSQLESTRPVGEDSGSFSLSSAQSPPLTERAEDD